MGVELDLLEHRHLPGDHHFAALSLSATSLVRLVEDLEHLQGDPEVGIGVVVDVGARDVRLALLPVEPVHVVLHALVDVDRLLVDQEGSREQVHLAKHPVPVTGGVDDDDVLRRAAAQAEGAGGKVLVTPVEPIVLGVADVAVFLEHLEQGGRLVDAEPLRCGHRQLEGGGSQMVHQHMEVVRVHKPVLHRPIEEVIRMRCQELVDGRR